MIEVTEIKNQLIPLKTINQIVIGDTVNQLVVDSTRIQLVVTRPALTLNAVARQGPPGPQGPQGLQGPQGPQGPPGGGGITALQDDLNPTLGGDLNLNGFQIIGQVNDTAFIVDGGLI